jgi:4-hydroxy-tetrahydrodipicolinate synthase
MKHDITALRGIVPPIITPLTDRFEVDYPSFTRVIEHLIAGGVHGLFFLGSTGEVVFHDAATRRRILEHAVKVVNGRVPILAGVVDPTTDRVIGNARDAAAIGADAVVVTAPFYTRTDQPEILDHFRYVAEASPAPMIAYNIPVCVHVKVERATIVTLAREGAIAGVKDSSGDAGNLRYVLNDLRDTKVWCMTGGELFIDGELLMGVRGAVPGIANVDPAGYVRLYDATQRGDWEAARREQQRLCRLFEITSCSLPRTSVGAAGFGGFKTALKAMGVIAHATTARPQRCLNAEETAKVCAILREVGLLH